MYELTSRGHAYFLCTTIGANDGGASTMTKKKVSDGGAVNPTQF